MKRSRFEIKLDTLKAIMTESKPTRIMYKANGSWVNFSPCVAELMKSGLIRQETQGRGKRYFLTDKGRLALESFSRLERLLEA